MHPPNPEFDLSKLRRQLEEILAIVKADDQGVPFVQGADGENELSVQENDVSVAETEAAFAGDRSESEPVCAPLLLEGSQQDERDDLYDDALVVLTEFGQASPAMLQMWLSIDYSRAMTILNRFQADGLVSPKGKVRHKAYSLRRSEA
jgi:DNA segregation ATPase FtsK/SpoIIIE-like protein